MKTINPIAITQFGRPTQLTTYASKNPQIDWNNYPEKVKADNFYFKFNNTAYNEDGKMVSIHYRTGEYELSVIL